MMCQPIEEIAAQLRADGVMGYQWSIVYARFRGRCGYCHRDLIADRFAYGCAEIDHLLPQVNYHELADEPLNLVLSCHLCNSTKGTHDVLGEGMDPQEALANEDERNLLIQAASTYIHNRLVAVHDPLWQQAKCILLGRPYFPEN